MNNHAVTSLLLGLLASASPCILPLYPGFLAYLGNQGELGKQKYFLGLFVLVGVLTMMITLGFLVMAQVAGAARMDSVYSSRYVRAIVERASKYSPSALNVVEYVCKPFGRWRSRLSKRQVERKAAE